MSKPTFDELPEAVVKTNELIILAIQIYHKSYFNL